LEYGENRDGYWTHDKFKDNIENAVKIANYKYPANRYKVCWIFDQSSCHKAYNDDALNAYKMNLSSGGTQPKMRDTVFNGKCQKLVDSKGVPKGLKQVLSERGVNTEGMNKAAMVEELSSHQDFKSEKNMVEHLIEEDSVDHVVLFFPKFHCELNPIERVWGQSNKRQLQLQHCRTQKKHCCSFGCCHY
jgi:transposase